MKISHLVDIAANHYATKIPRRVRTSDPVQVVALVGPSTFEYLITLLAVSRLGHTVLFLSTRISEEAIISLLEATSAKFIITHSLFSKIGSEVSQKTGTLQLPLLDGQVLNSNARVQSVSSFELNDPKEQQKIAWIIHSSGSTGLPKPIYQTHIGALRNYALNFGLRGYITLPLFHAHGISCIFRAIHSQKLIYMYSGETPLKASCLLDTLKNHKEIEVLYGVPYALKLLSETDDGLEALARLELVMFGGSACPKSIGDNLVQHGIRLVSHYGTTETGQLMTSFRERDDLDWDYVRPTEDLMPFMLWEERFPGIYELCIKDGWPSKVATNRPDGSYATKDLFEKHPTRPNAWRFYARLDDTLVLENGEKANPLLIEGVARNNPKIADAVAFGANKPRVGLFLIAALPNITPEEAINSVWPAIQESNDRAPAYARVSREMIRVLPSSTVYRRTDKGTVIRPAFYRDFAKEIDQIYEQNDVATGDLVLEGEDLVNFIRKQVLEIAQSWDETSLTDDSDLFSLGFDSLQSIRLRSVLQKSLYTNHKKLSTNFVFENPSLSKMAAKITAYRKGECDEAEVSIEQQMQDLIDKYTANMERYSGKLHPVLNECVVVTGATGSLGAHVVGQLAVATKVTTIYCLVRAKSDTDADKRVKSSLSQRQIALSPEQSSKVVSLASDISDAHLGLGDMYDTILSKVTAVIHCAWSVNFNWSLGSFEKDCILGTRNLLDLSLKSKSGQAARFAFCSSVSAVVRTPGGIIPEELPKSLEYAQGMGYAQSKVVTEHIVNAAAKKGGVPARVLRIGQIVADTRKGIWNTTEAIPLIFQSAKTIGALPLLDEELSWTPVDVIASSVIDISLSNDCSHTVFNVTNPRLVNWTKDLLPLLRENGLEFEGVDKREWVRRLRSSNPDPSVNPPIKLLDFFATKYDNDNPRPFIQYNTSYAQQFSPSLDNASPLDSDLVGKFLKYFTKEWAAQCS